MGEPKEAAKKRRKMTIHQEVHDQNDFPGRALCPIILEYRGYIILQRFVAEFHRAKLRCQARQIRWMTIY
jgi:hypothetical protein